MTFHITWGGDQYHEGPGWVATGLLRPFWVESPCTAVVFLRLLPQSRPDVRLTGPRTAGIGSSLPVTLNWISRRRVMDNVSWGSWKPLNGPCGEVPLVRKWPHFNCYLVDSVLFCNSRHHLFTFSVFIYSLWFSDDLLRCGIFFFFVLRARMLRQCLTFWSALKWTPQAGHFR